MLKYVYNETCFLSDSNTWLLLEYRTTPTCEYYGNENKMPYVESTYEIKCKQLRSCKKSGGG